MAPAARVQVYNEAYFARIHDAIAADFSGVRRCIGHAGFQQLVADYLVAHPPQHFSLRYIGQHLPAFVGQQPLLNDYPYLAELADFEWQLFDIYDAADVPLLSETQLQQVPPAEWPQLPLRAQPAVRLGRYAWPVDRIYEAVLDETERTKSHEMHYASNAVSRPQQDISPTAPLIAPTWQPEATPLLLWRPQLDVKYRRCTAEEFTLLQTIMTGTHFATLCEQALAVFAEMDAASLPHKLGGLLQRWVQDGILEQSA